MTKGDRVRYIGARLFTEADAFQGYVFRMPMASPSNWKEGRVLVQVGQEPKPRAVLESDLEVIS